MWISQSYRDDTATAREHQETSGELPFAFVHPLIVLGCPRYCFFSSGVFHVGTSPYGCHDLCAVDPHFVLILGFAQVSRGALQYRCTWSQAGVPVAGGDHPEARRHARARLPGCVVLWCVCVCVCVFVCLCVCVFVCSCVFCDYVVCILCMLCVCCVFCVFCVYVVCILCMLCVFCVYVVYCVYVVCILCVFCVYVVCMLFVVCMYFVCIFCVLCVYFVCILCVVCV